MSLLANFLADRHVHFVAVASESLTFHTSCDGAHSGQVDNTLSAYQGDTRVGYIQYSVYNDKPSVGYIKVEPEFRRQKVGTKLLQQLQREFPDTEIDLGGLTDDGAALHKSLRTSRTDNPRVQELQAELDSLQQKLDSYTKLAEAHRNKVDKTDADYEQFIKSVEDWNELSDRADDIKHELATTPTGKTLISTAAEEIPETITVDGKQRPTRNSDGRLIHPTLKGIENFWRWFGESTVVDAASRPVIMYHSTPNDFNVFIRKRGEAGMHFGTLDQADERHKQRKDNVGKPVAMMPVYLRIINPTRMKDVGTWDKARFGHEATFKGVNPNESLPVTRIVKALKAKGFDAVIYKNEAEVPGSHDMWEELGAQKKLALEAVRLKFGKNSEEYELGSKNYWFALESRLSSMPEVQKLSEISNKIRDNRRNGTDSYMVFDPTQIKSATGNNGDFSPSVTSITASTAETITVDGKARPVTNSKGQKIHPTLKGIENFWRWFGDSHLVDDQGRPRVFLHGTKANFDTFEHVDSENRVSGIDPTASIGYHFTEDPGVAGKFADGLYLQKYEKAGGSIMPVYLRAKSILKTTETDMVDAMSHGDYSRLREVEYAVGNYVYENDADEDHVWSQYENNSVFRSGINKSALDLSRSQSEDELDYELAERMASDYLEQVIRSGHDAIEYRNDVEGGTSWIMFDSNQIKSATGNTGEFSQTEHAVTAHYKVLQSLALGSCVDGVNMSEGEPFYGKPVEFFQSALASYEATAVSKKDKLKAQQKNQAPASAPVQQQKRIVDMGIRYNKIDGLNESCLDVALAILEALANNKQYAEMQNPGIVVDGITYHMTPQFMTATHADLRGIVYFRLDDKTNKKHWRFYYKTDRDRVALLDIYDKDGNSVDKNQVERLARQAKAFDRR